MEQLLPNSDFNIVIRSDKRPVEEHEHRFNAPAAKYVAILLIGEQYYRRNIIIHERDSRLTCVSETHQSYDSLQNPLIFWQLQDAHHFHIPQVHPIKNSLLTKGYHPMTSTLTWWWSDLTIQSIFCYAVTFSINSRLSVHAKIKSGRFLFIRQHQKKSTCVIIYPLARCHCNRLWCQQHGNADHSAIYIHRKTSACTRQNAGCNGIWQDT